MAGVDPYATQGDLVPEIPAELRGAGFDDVTEIGHGGFGVVYRCVQTSLDRTVAVKVLSSDLDPDNVDRFMREQRAMGRLSGHPHIVQILEVGTTASGRPFIVMPYHAKDSLEAVIRKHGPLDWSEALTIGVKLAGALDAAHQVGTLHRDVKPANILLTDYGEPQLTDFGIARIAGGFQTATGVITGSPAFTAPEVLEGAAPTERSDVYSLGATLFCALTGHAAYERRSGEQVVAQFLRVTSQPVPDLREHGLPGDVAAIIERAMSRDPSDRPTSATQFGDELRETQRGSGVVVDEMARPVELGVERRESTGALPTPRRETTMTPTPPTPATKYRPPVAARALLPRDRLTEILRAGGRRRLVLIHAPSGFGKSTLAAQWREALVHDGVAVGWLTIDDDDNNVVWFLVHLLESIRRVRPELAASLCQILEEHGDDAGRYVLTSLIDEIHEKDDRIALVIDDWQRVSDAGTTAALGFLLEHGCHHLQIIVTSWSRSGLPVSKLRIQDEIVEIDGGSLRFDEAEAQSFLNDIGGLKLSGADVNALTTSTDGWAAALQLATLSLRAGADAGRLMSGLCGANDVICEFLAENVLDTLEPELAEFMLATSVTQKTCGDLASMLARTTRGQAMLEEVERRGLFLQQVEGEPGWFRYHQMFAEFLRRRLERDRPDGIGPLHRCASSWFAEHGYLSEAVDHALAAGDPGHAVQLVEEDETRLLEQSKMTTLLGIIDKLPPRAVASRPRVQLNLAWAHILLQHSAQANTALNRFEAAVDGAERSEAAQADLRAEANVVRGVAEIFADRVDGVDALVAEAMSRPDTLHPRVAGVAGNVAAFAAICRFDFDDAHRLLEWAAPYQEMMGPFASVYARCYGGIAARYQLDIELALTSFREAYELGARVGPHSHAARLACALLGQLLHETGEYTEAARLLDESYQLGAEGGGVDCLVARYVVGARIKAAHGDRASAVDHLDAGMKTADKLRMPRLAAAINNQRIRLGIDMPQTVTDRLRTSRTIPHDGGIATMTAELDEDSGIRILLASDFDDDREQAHRRADQLLAGIDIERRPLAGLNARLLRIETLAATNRNDEARAEQADIESRLAGIGLVTAAWR
ncbi:MAG: serine/threonine-protein kinase PknK [Mycobacterium sp.]|nr:serine/threonine-protein kinase PknK [Mycobacterium sp.]